ncbi:FHA domain-containing protein [Leptolyngbya sp. PCC 6406]|uniref:FHA domain-containing protein n=1 Tax=Leptolyngbya sp. PCC 6406 TaxID=1173264 RepID=UPI0002AC96E8|nr:FHA domain-containing protein [Leptolyngbya sp. PCC 6406]
MLDPKALSEYALAHLDSSQEDVQRSLNLFQAFKRVYDQNPALVTELLNLETPAAQSTLRSDHLCYVLGLVTDKQPLILTNLLKGRSQIFLRTSSGLPIWTIGRDPQKAALSLRDRRLSRCHAALVYDKNHGFMIHDLGSTNGTFVNGVRIRHGYTLQDGDHIRLGSLNFRFFHATEFRRTAAPSAEVLQWLDDMTIPPTTPIPEEENMEHEPDSTPNLEETLHFLRRNSRDGGTGNGPSHPKGSLN